MPKSLKRTKCDNLKSVFDYSLLLKPSGAIKLFDKKGEPIPIKILPKPPRIKYVKNVRECIIIEAVGSNYIWISGMGWIAL